MTTVEQIENKGLAYKFVRGSQLYNTSTPESDTDFGGVYIADNATLMGLSEYYEPQISDDKHDTTYYELGRWVELLMKANPNALESLFAPEDKIIGEIHPAVQLIREHRDLFVTKECFNSLTGYAISQIKKCRGLNKKCVQPVLERKDVLDFCYTFKNQGSQSMKDFLAEHGLDQKYCGLVNIPNMKDVYGVYYDFAAHWKFEKTNISILVQADKLGYTNTSDIAEISDRYYDDVFFGYSGIVHPDGKSNEVRLSSIPKGEKPICFMTYNQNGYESHCRKYKEYQEWVEKRNPVRYESNLKSNYDCYLEKETEFLTDTGWKKFDEITANDLLGCFNEKHELQFKPALNRFDDLYSGEIYTYDSPYVKFSITPNHKLYISDCHRNPKNNFSTKYDEKLSNWRLESLEKIFNNKRSYYHQIQCLTNNKIDNPEFDDDFIKILGMFLSEGCYLRNKKTKKPNGIRIAQTNERSGCEIMDSIKKYKIKKYVYSYESRNKGNEYAYDCTDDFVLEKILECGDCHAIDKRIPNYVYSFSKRQFDILLNAMICGDGTYHKQKGHRVYYTFSEKMAKDLHTLLTLNGYNSQIYEYNYDNQNRFKRKDGIMNPTYQVFISKFNKQYHVFDKKKHFEKRMVDNERIVCFETELGTLITRNDNKMAFHGNCKNVMHCVRLLHMGKELAEGKGFNVVRTWDRDFLLDIRNHKYEYEYIMDYVENLFNDMKELIETCPLPETVDRDKVNELLIKARTMV